MWDLIPPALGAVAILVCLAYAFYKRRFMTFSIMFACVLVFILEIVSVSYIGAYPWRSTTAEYLAFSSIYLFERPWMLFTVFTSMFVHSGIGHLIFNLVALIMLGMILEDRVGTYRFAIIYLTSGIFATFFFVIFSPNSQGLLMGASGAFCGVLGAFTRLFPKEKIRMFMFFILLPALPMYIIAIMFLALETVFAAMGGFNLVGQLTGEGGHVAHAAHIGGFIFGLVVSPWVMRLEFKEPGKPAPKVKVDMRTLGRLAVTKEQKDILEKIEKEDVPDVKRAWIEELAERSRCPDCGRKLKVSTRKVGCRCGFRLRF